MGERNIVFASAKRKTAVAAVTVREGKGRIKINNVPLGLWQPELAKWKIMEPLLLAGEDISQKVDIDAKVKGGGFMSQAEAVQTAISRALYEWTKNEDLKRRFIEYNRHMLVGDPRQKEPKKFGGRGARARFQKSKR